MVGYAAQLQFIKLFTIVQPQVLLERIINKCENYSDKLKNLLPSSEEILKDAVKAGHLDINLLHSKTYELLKGYRSAYYQRRVNEFLSKIRIPAAIKSIVKRELLKPIIVNGKTYSNFMEEVSRRVSQTLQVVSGNIAERCVERELVKKGLKIGINYAKKAERTDIILYYPNCTNFKRKHRVEVKNVKLRERGARGLLFDGDSMMGFFDDPSEFTKSTIAIIDKHCKKSGGYCYIPPVTLKQIRSAGERFKSNTEFASDMEKFTLTGSIQGRI